MAATEPRRLRKKSYRSPGPLGMAATLVLSSDGHAQNGGPSKDIRVAEDVKKQPGGAVSLSSRVARLAGPLLRIHRSGSPRQRTCGQGEARTCALSSLSCSVGIASEALQGGTWACPAVFSFATPNLVR